MVYAHALCFVRSTKSFEKRLVQTFNLKTNTLSSVVNGQRLALPDAYDGADFQRSISLSCLNDPLGDLDPWCAPL